MVVRNRGMGNKSPAGPGLTITIEPEKDEHVAADTDDATNVPSPVGIPAGKRIFSDEDRAVE